MAALPSGGLDVLEPGTGKALLTVAVPNGMVEELLWPEEETDASGDPDPDHFDADHDDEADLDDDHVEEPVEVVVAGRLVPRGVVAELIGRQWVDPHELSRVPRPYGRS